MGIKKVSKPRQVQIAHYERVKKELKQELIDSGEWVCFFSGTPLPEKIKFHPHHLKGRDGDLITAKEYLVPCLWEYHFKFHHTPFSKLKEEWWWSGFMNRLRRKDRDLWEKYNGLCNRSCS